MTVFANNFSQSFFKLFDSQTVDEEIEHRSQDSRKNR